MIALEIKASSTYQTDQFRGLRELKARLGEQFIAGVVLGTADHGYRFADRLCGLPLSALWEL